ncbi:F0F1 ATP synthase subunit epsilon [Psychroserpens sp.]|uniref:F0F1 ATP synthase subunit epsilon n=1 Tax=Psychroserpens sp. TaxID=2020870 RepID=UPI001B296FEA|nr:F0F1 ATP synthase subunit epsilon [Psychroserpens sp.]MBO6605553.1 F0F1 ATP synthase subunit epsilon [Psychroserpens sp.]MBO6630872.1 F0F1 ATP synthase subunit epsilon [Psychroserpens sp.]MBO6653638.1 F0F1 ATP synthase subunit epsilon [Psychroserpens sp.]MBO6681959.1 F0F1 ATP synthase subunit epsilon [Psychroserpens sp.]MBO6748927.1 F0F1 ATP synthase subunit epsilon [Psychroserpens sp.]
MHLEIVSPEATLFSGEVTSVTVPGVMGEFEMLNNHAPIISLLKEGNVKINGDITLEEDVENLFNKSDKGFWLPISSGTIEMKDNKVIVLAD